MQDEMHVKVCLILLFLLLLPSNPAAWTNRVVDVTVSGPRGKTLMPPREGGRLETL